MWETFEKNSSKLEPRRCSSPRFGYQGEKRPSREGQAVEFSVAPPFNQQNASSNSWEKGTASPRTGSMLWRRLPFPIPFLEISSTALWSTPENVCAQILFHALAACDERLVGDPPVAKVALTKRFNSRSARSRSRFARVVDTKSNHVDATRCVCLGVVRD